MSQILAALGGIAAGLVICGALIVLANYLDRE